MLEAGETSVWTKTLWTVVGCFHGSAVGWSWIGLARERFSILYIPEQTETPSSLHGTTYTDADQRKKW